MGFTKKIRQNAIGPKDGSEPLTVIEFSLTNDIRDSLKEALKPYVEGRERDKEKLAQIIKDHFPPEVLTELSALSRDKGSPATVYVVKNLPEIKSEEIPRDFFFSSYYLDSLGRWLSACTYAARIGEGVGLALGLVPRVEGAPVFRYRKEGTQNDRLHKHAEDVNILGGVFSEDKAPTRFVDYRTMLEQAQDDKESGNIEARLIGNDLPLRELANADKDSRFRSTGEKDFVPKYRHEAAFEKLVSAHSQEVVIDSGDLVLWANDGRLFHQAMPGHEPEEGGYSLVRAVVGWGFRRNYKPSQ